MFSSKQAKPVSVDKVETIIGAGTTLHGNVVATGTIRVDGRLTGEVVTEGDLIIGQTGQVWGTVRGRNITIAGRLEGSADAEGLLHLAATAVVKGDIIVQSFTVEEGAKYKGSCQMKTDVIELELEAVTAS